ncbi:uncharacterized protein ATNIH1004_001874 [Aspergillus tanneri]|uniref:Uncharacterized protein n=1 Tax=Aspergillus tanneri TaxID=1220188 RepID=A0A5M9MA38_9EURO|nr:uncharacterized protein ATNIH1004_001874 [Aspergillus tanneri]KAA8641409.1 hypothetical protein ATNIH1004_001874 [Aspergillus tanneri]
MAAEAEATPSMSILSSAHENEPLTAQLNSYKRDNENLRTRLTALHARVSDLQIENAKVHQELTIECRQHALTVKELLQLREQVQRLDETYASLQQSVGEICQRAASLRIACQNVEERYAHGRNPMPGSFQPRQLLRQRLQHGPITLANPRPWRETWRMV